MADDVLVILQEAINKEEDRQAYYEDAAQRACNPLAQQTFAFLAKQEQGHAEYIRRYYDKMRAEQSWPDPALCGDACGLEAEDIKGIFANARAAIDGEVTCSTDLSEAYQIAMQGERDSITFYKGRLEAATDANARAFYEALLAAERTHLQLLANTDEYLNAPDRWHFDQEQWIVEG